jgi:hypothetical protein
MMTKKKIAAGAAVAVKECMTDPLVKSATVQVLNQ